MNIAHRQPGVPRVDLNFAIGGLHNGDERFAGQITLQSAKIRGRDYNHFVASRHRARL
jgi:hypothetical protein